MDNSHLPNDHPGVHPGWKPYPFPRTPFPELLKLKVVKRQDGGEVHGNVPLYYCAAIGKAFAVHGGVSATLSVKAAELYHQEIYPDTKTTKAKPQSFHIEYLQPVPQGDFKARVKAAKAGGRSPCYQVTLHPRDAPDESLPCTTALVRLTVGDSSGNGDAGKMVQEPLEMIPDRLKDCSRWGDARFYALNPISSSMRCWAPNDGDSMFWSPKFGGRSVRYQWFKADDEQPFQPERLPLVSDLIAGLALNHEKDPLKATFMHLMPTTSMDMTFRSDVTGNEWLLCRAQMQKLQDGWFDMDISTYTETGDLVATCRQVCSYIPIKKPKRDSKTKSNL